MKFRYVLITDGICLLKYITGFIIGIRNFIAHAETGVCVGAVTPE